METTNNTTVYPDGLQAAWYNTLAFIPKFLAFVAILVIGYFVAMFIGKAVDRLLSKVGMDRALENSGIRAALAKSGQRPSQIVGRIAFYTGMLFVMHLAFGMFGPNPVSDLLTRIIAFLPNVFVAIALVVVAAQIATVVRDLISATLGGLSYGKMLANLAAFSIVVIGVFAALTQLNIAPQIVLGLYYAMLAIVVGVSIVAIGGSGISALRPRWETALNKIEEEVPRVRDEVRTSRESATPAERPSGYAI